MTLVFRKNFDDVTIQFAMIVSLHCGLVAGLLNFIVSQSLSRNSTSTDRFVYRARPVSNVMTAKAREHRVDVLLKLKCFGWPRVSLVGSRGSLGSLRSKENGSAILTKEKQEEVTMPLLDCKVKLIHSKTTRGNFFAADRLLGEPMQFSPMGWTNFNVFILDVSKQLFFFLG